MLAVSASAQETVFNVPNADVLDRGKFYAEFDFSYRPSDGGATYTPRFVAGAGHRIEVGINVGGLATPGNQHTTPTPNIKWKAYDGGDNGWAFVVGDNVFLPAQNRRYNAGNYAYLEFAKAWKTKTRVTAGAYYFTRDVVSTGQRAGGQFAIEQPINSRLTLAADWYTGDQVLGYLTPGAAVKLTPAVTWYILYQIGNHGVTDGNHQLLTEVGWNF